MDFHKKIVFSVIVLVLVVGLPFGYRLCCGHHHENEALNRKIFTERTKELLQYILHNQAYKDKVEVTVESTNKVNVVNEAITENTALMNLSSSDYDKDGYKEICDYFGTPILILIYDLEDRGLIYKISENATISIDRKIIPEEQYILLSLGPNKVFDDFKGDDIVLSISEYSGYQVFSDILSKFRKLK